MNTPNGKYPIWSLVEARGLPLPPSLIDLIWLERQKEFTLPSPLGVFSSDRDKTIKVIDTLFFPRICKSLGTYVAVLQDAIIGFDGSVWLDGGLLYESVYPWAIENFYDQFHQEPPDLNTCFSIDDLYFAREGGDVGYFHFIAAVMMKTALAKFAFSAKPNFIINTQQIFAQQALSMLGIRPRLTAANANVKKLYFPSPSNIEGDHYTRSPFLASLFFENIQSSLRLSSKAPTRKVYLSRRNANVRRLSNEDELIEFMKGRGFEIIVAEELSFSVQVQIFLETAVLVSTHGAGLANLAFMMPDTLVIEILNPNRIWPTFRTMAFRHRVRYVAVVAYLSSGSPQCASEGNEDIECDLSLVRSVITNYA